MTRHFKTYAASNLKASETMEEGTFEALVSVFGNVDLYGDRVVKGAFKGSLERWKAAGDPIPVIWAHQWNDLDSHLGVVLEAEERDEGLWIKAQLDMDEAPARKVWRKMQARAVKEFSFAYDVLDERKAKEDGANELLELELLEVGPCLKGVNPATQLLEVKGLEGLTPELIAGLKAGRVLSSKNEQAIRDAVGLLSGVLKQLDAETKPAEDEDEAKAQAKGAGAPEEPGPRSPADLRAEADAIRAMAAALAASTS